jgi:hypothetical protein
MTYDTSMSCTQAEFGIIVGISQSAVSQLIADGKIPADGTLGDWLHSYLQNLRYQIELRQGDGSLDLVQERAYLAKVQREAWELKNAAMRQEYAPTEMLEQVLSVAQTGVANGLDQLQSELNRIMVTYPQAARGTVLQIVESARNEWLRSTANLIQNDMVSIATDDDPILDDGQEDSPTVAEGAAQ